MGRATARAEAAAAREEAEEARHREHMIVAGEVLTLLRGLAEGQKTLIDQGAEQHVNVFPGPLSTKGFEDDLMRRLARGGRVPPSSGSVSVEAPPSSARTFVAGVGFVPAQVDGRALRNGFTPEAKAPAHALEPTGFLVREADRRVRAQVEPDPFGRDGWRVHFPRVRDENDCVTWKSNLGAAHGQRFEQQQPRLRGVDLDGQEAGEALDFVKQIEDALYDTPEAAGDAAAAAWRVLDSWVKVQRGPADELLATAKELVPAKKVVSAT